MEEAYMKASANNTLPANARQIMYAARPLIIQLAGKPCESSYFTQTLLKDFLDEHPELTQDWDVVYDARGKLIEPHTGERVDIGTLAVRQYIRDFRPSFSEGLMIDLDHRVPTHGPDHRYRFALFVEKEGFEPLLQRANIAERYDIANMSTKGMSVIAARTLVEKLSERGVTILVIRDFDKVGFSIVHTLRSNTKRYTYRTSPNVIDLGLRLEDVKALNLESEQVSYRGSTDPRENLRESGATEDECNFLVRRQAYHGGGGWEGQRVELNAMTSEQFIAWLEEKLQAYGVQKVVPNQTTLEKAYRRVWKRAIIQEAIDRATKELSDDDITVPPDLNTLVCEKLKEDDEQAWDDAVWEIVRKHRQDQGEVSQ